MKYFEWRATFDRGQYNTNHQQVSQAHVGFSAQFPGAEEYTAWINQHVSPGESGEHPTLVEIEAAFEKLLVLLDKLMQDKDTFDNGEGLP